MQLMAKGKELNTYRETHNIRIQGEPAKDNKGSHSVP